jgi:hypothetical protein
MFPLPVLPFYWLIKQTGKFCCYLVCLQARKPKTDGPFSFYIAYIAGSKIGVGFSGKKISLEKGSDRWKSLNNTGVEGYFCTCSRSVELLWMRDRPISETYTWQHATPTKDIHSPGGIWKLNSSKRDDRRPTPKPCGQLATGTAIWSYIWRCRYKHLKI